MKNIELLFEYNKSNNIKKELLQYNDGFIGFNKENDFLGHIPDISIFEDSIFFPGTAYNLNFAIRKGEIENGE